jgi:aryl sulfotransferase
MPPTPTRYTSPDEDSARWLDFSFRDGDIVISTRSKSGNTWMQMICALLVFQTPELPAPLAHLSPWLDWLVLPLDAVLDRLTAQTHRRFIKTHTPLDGVPISPLATYVVVARHPLDAAVSLYHQGSNMNRDRLHELTGQPPPTSPPSPRLDLHDWLARWIDKEVEPATDMDSLSGFLWHASDAWSRRHEPNVMLVHYADLAADLGAEMRRIAERLDMEPAEHVWPELVRSATFDHMRARAADLAPDPSGVFKDKSAFFRSGTSGIGAVTLTDTELTRYHKRVEQALPPELVSWLHR